MADDHPELNKDFTLAELVDTDFVRCEYCRAVFTKPLLLPCLHTFCEKCIEDVIVRENVDTLKQEQIIEAKYEKPILNGHGGPGLNHGIPIKGSNTSNGHGGRYTFNCPTCKSPITIEQGRHLQTTTSTDQENDENNDVAKSDQKTALENSDQTDGTHTCPSTRIQSLDISPSAYKSLKHAITHSLPSNHFIHSVTRLYRYKREEGRECAYCKTEDVKEDATCLCLQCDDDVCDGCAGAHRKTRVTRHHSVVPYTAIQQGLFDHDIRKAYGIKCQDHADADVTHFCHDCLKVVCKPCRTKRHHNHKIHPVTDAATKMAADIQTVQSGLSRRIPDLSQYIQFLTQQLTSLQQRHQEAIDDINTQVQLIHRMVDEWRDNILSDMDTLVTQERQIIQDKITNFNTTKSSTEKSASFLRHLFNLGKADEKMGTYASIMRRYQQLIRSKPRAMKTRLDISFTPGPTTGHNIRILIGQLGVKQEDFDAKDTAKSRIPISSLMPATLDSPVRTKSWTIHPSSVSTSTETDTNIKTPLGSPCYISGIDIKGNMLAVVDRGNAKVIILDYTSQKVLKEFTGSGSHKLRKPFDIAFLPSGALAVTDPEASDVKVFDWTGKFLFTFDAEIQQKEKWQGHKGRRDKHQEDDEGDGGQPLAMRHPRGITLTKNGEAVVVDGHFRHCTVYDSNTGKIIKTIYPHKESKRQDKNHDKSSGSNTNNFEDKNSTDHDSRIVEMSINPETEHMDVVLVDPFYICTTQDGNLVITDAASPNVKILGWPSGVLLQESLDYGIRQEECLHPAGVCVDHKSCYMLLVDTNNNRIHLGLPDGQFHNILIPPTKPTPSTNDKEVQSDTNSATLTLSQKVDTDTYKLSHPTCLCLDQDGHVVVGQVGGQISVYKYL